MTLQPSLNHNIKAKGSKAVKSLLLLTILLSLFIIPCSASAQQKSDTTTLVLSKKFEIGITPRGEYLRDHKISPADTGYYYFIGVFRFQAGMQIYKSSYLHVFSDYYHVRTDLDFHSKKIDAFGFGLQYSLKFEKALEGIRPIKLYKKPIYIRWYPELLVSAAMINLANDLDTITGLHESEAYHAYYQYGIIWNFYFNKWSHLSIMFLQEYQPHIKHDPYSFGPMQTRFVLKL